MLTNLSKSVKQTRVSNAVAAGTAEILSTSVDARGLDAVEFLVAFGAITAGAVTSIKVQGSHDNVTFVDLAGSGVVVADTDDNKIIGVDQSFPTYRYLRCAVERATQNSVVDGIFALQYMADKEPVTQPATTSIKFLPSPIAGAA